MSSQYLYNAFINILPYVTKHRIAGYIFILEAANILNPYSSFHAYSGYSCLYPNRGATALVV